MSRTPFDQPGLDELLHRLAAGSRGVEDQAVEAAGFEFAADRRHARRRDAEHRHARSPACRRTAGRVVHHAGHGAAALPSTRRDTAFKPAMSTTECIIVMSPKPT